jgi:hypothetical protein
MKRIVIICLSTILFTGYMSIYSERAGAYIREIYNYSPNIVEIIDSDSRGARLWPKGQIRTDLFIGPKEKHHTYISFVGIPDEYRRERGLGGYTIKGYSLYDNGWEICDEKGPLICRKKNNNVILYLTPNKTLRFFIVKE